MKTTTIALILFLTVSVCHAADGKISKVVKPDIIIVPEGGGTGLSQFFLSHEDFPRNARLRKKTLKGIDWSTTSYPNNTY